MTTPCTPTAPCAECADADRRDMGHVLLTPETCDHGERGYDLSYTCPICNGGLAVCANCGQFEAGLDNPCKSALKPHDTTCDHGHPCAMCVETAERGYEALAMDVDDDYWAVATDVAGNKASSLIQPPDAARHSRNQQDYDDDFKRRYHAYQKECAERLDAAQDTFVPDESETGNTWNDADLAHRRTANTEFDDDWLMAPRDRTRYVTQDDAFYWWWRGLQQGLALGVTQGNRDLQQMIRLAKERL